MIPKNSLAPTPVAELPDELRARWPVAQERARGKVAALQSSPSRAGGLFAAAQQARSRLQRVIWLQRAASAWIEPLAAVAACRRGCAHCCHIPVMVSATEARLLAQASGRKAAAPVGIACDPALIDQALQWKQAQRVHIGQPCPFLTDGACSVYEHRPIVCRTHLSLDDDDLLCRLVPGVDVPVPYADVRAVHAMAFAAQPGETIADIRDYFPHDAAHAADAAREPSFGTTGTTKAPAAATG